MAINFPDTPSTGDTHTVGSVTWEWDGATWKSQGTQEVLSAASPLSYDGGTKNLTIDLSSYYTSAQADTAISTAVSNLVDSAPATLDTLNELAAALGDDANFATTVTNSLASKKNEVSQAVSSNITLQAGYRYFVDTTTARTLTLPATPSLGDEVQIFDASFSAATNNITVNRNGEEINNTADDALLDVDGVAAVFVYTGSSSGWRMG